MDPVESWIASAREGDEQALRSLLERYLPDLHAYVRLRAGRMLLTRESSADLVQSVCREALGELEGFEYRGEKAFRSWLYTVAQRKLADRYDYYRAQKRDVHQERPLPSMQGAEASQAEIELADRYASFLTPSRHLAVKQFVERVERAFAELPEHYREVVLLARSEGLTHAQIAERTGRSPGSVRMLLSRAMAELARLLDVEP
jgi:RNA polymerase sigma-70 factor (ECF subfamily)